MNAYAKIAIKVAVVVIICIVMISAYNTLVHKQFVVQNTKRQEEIDQQRAIADQLNKLLAYSDILPQIRYVQVMDMETIRNLVPSADQYSLTSYLRVIHATLSSNHLETDGINIHATGKAVGGVNFDEVFASDLSSLQADLDTIMTALDYFKENMGNMNNLLQSYQFYTLLSTKQENYGAIIGGIETHAFSLSAKGSYEDLKKFTFDIFNMRPHTALVNFQMSPAGQGFGRARTYVASFQIVTYGDINTAPSLDQAKKVLDKQLHEGETGSETNSGNTKPPANMGAAVSEKSEENVAAQ